jgi:hypothetical protein
MGAASRSFPRAAMPRTGGCVGPGRSAQIATLAIVAMFTDMLKRDRERWAQY